MMILEVKNLKKSFSNHTVLDGVSFQVEEHSIYGFLGQNGAGKTTTMKIILGLLQADSGEVWVNGEKVTYGQTRTNQYIGYLPDVPEYYSYMTPTEYLHLCGEITGMNKVDSKRKIEELLQLVGLDKSNKKIGGFSRGMKQRLGIAQALLNEPKLLICDEPTSALDPIGRKEILDILYRVKEKTTVIFSTHILSDVERICDTIALMHSGKIHLQGDLIELKNTHKHDGIEIEFANQIDLNCFLEKATEIQSFCKQKEDATNTLELRGGNSQQIPNKALQILSNNQIIPIKFMKLELTLEELFMEVIKE